MAYEVYAKDCINWWKAQVGKPCGKTNEYSAYMDSYNFYNTKKNGVANSCAIFYDTAIMKTMTPEANANAGRAILCEPNVDNCGAGCTQKVQYYKNAGRWYTKTSDAQSGDEIFFKKSDGSIYHTGAIVDWSDKKKEFYVVEGNTNGGWVAQKTYAYGDSKIAGFGRPKWTGWERPQPNPEPTPTPEPTPDPEPTPTPSPEAKKYKVNVSSYLSTRNAPTVQAKELGRLFNGAIVNVYEQKNGWGRITGDLWCSMTYLREQ